MFVFSPPSFAFSFIIIISIHWYRKVALGGSILAMASMGPGPNKEQPEIEKLDKRKQEIMRINRDPNLSPAEKQKAIQVGRRLQR